MRSLVLIACVVFLAACNRFETFYAAGGSNTEPRLNTGTRRVLSQKFNLADITDEEESYKPVDVLWVVDNSGSMAAHQTTMKANAASFMNSFILKSGLDWRMGVISTDANNNPFIAMDMNTSTASTIANISSSNLMAVDIFNTAINSLGTKGSGTEKVFTPVMKFLNSSSGYLRPDALLALIIVTDAEEQSKDVTVNAFVDYLRTKKGDLSKVLIYGALGPSDFGCKQTDTPWAYKGSRHEAFMKATNGAPYVLCSNTFGSDLLKITDNLVNRTVTTEAKLSDLADAEGIEVWYNGLSVPQGPASAGGEWIYDPASNSVKVHDRSRFTDPTLQVEVRYYHR